MTDQQQYMNFFKERLIHGSKSLPNPLPCTNLELFHSPRRQVNKHRLKITDLRHDLNVFCKLYIASQCHKGDVDDFIAHKNSIIQIFPNQPEGRNLRVSWIRSTNQCCTRHCHIVIPKNFSSVLVVSSNKQQLFSLIGKFLVSRTRGHKVLMSTIEDTACAKLDYLDLSSVSPCIAEEANGYLLLLAEHVAKSGHSNVTIHTIDSDVVVIVVSAYNHI